MKKITALLLTGAMVLGLAACGNKEASETSSGSTSDNQQTESNAQTGGQQMEEKAELETGSNALVVYFSVPETDSTDDMNQEEENSTVVVDGEVLGNTQYVAYQIQQNTGADIFRIEPETPYPMDHAQLEEVATKEVNEDAKPAILNRIEDIDQYQTIFVGYPNWYGDMPRILYTFFEEYELSGKTIVPFITSGASGFSNTICTIEELEPDSEVITDGFSILRNEIEDAASEIERWLSALGYAK